MVRGDEIGELLRRTSRDVGREFLTSQFRPDLVNRWGSFLLASTPTYASGSRFSGLWRRSFFWSPAAATLRTLFRMSPGRFSASLVSACVRCIGSKLVAVPWCQPRRSGCLKQALDGCACEQP